MISDEVVQHLPPRAIDERAETHILPVVCVCVDKVCETRKGHYCSNHERCDLSPRVLFVGLTISALRRVT